MYQGVSNRAKNASKISRSQYFIEISGFQMLSSHIHFKISPRFHKISVRFRKISVRFHKISLRSLLRSLNFTEIIGKILLGRDFGFQHLHPRFQPCCRPLDLRGLWPPHYTLVVLATKNLIPPKF